MKTGIAISSIAHALVLAGAMVSLASPPPMSAPDVEALPIDIIPIETLTKSVVGERTAPKLETPAPQRTTQPQTRPDAVNVGEAENDTQAQADRVAPEPPVEQTQAPAPAPRSQPQEPTPVPTPELAQEPEPRKDIAMLLREAQPEPKPTEPPEETLTLPERVATPKPRPAAPQPERARTDQRQQERDVAEAARKAQEEKERNEAREKAVVNRAQEAAGGAKRSNREESLGTSRGNNANRLAQSEIDALRGRLEGCWSAGILSGNPDAAKIRAEVRFALNRAGEIDGRVRVKVTGGDRRTKAAFSISVQSAVNECAPYKLPADKYENWANVVVNFSLADML
ncbi:MAG: hypothetical protein OXR62_12745 [Ahrensia sp.]|nr:hypothetical protein [Ahrensia sp.]